MNNAHRQLTPTAATLVLISVVVGVGTYAGRVWWHRSGAVLPGGAPETRPAASLPPRERLTPERLSAAAAAERQLPHELQGYRLVSVVPEVEGHDMHALYESDHHVSLFVRPIVPHPGKVTSRDVGPHWGATEPLLSYPAFTRTDVHHRAALAWIARGKRHIVTGDVPLEQLRTFAAAYEQALPR